VLKGSFRLSEAWTVAKCSGLITTRAFFALAAYYSVTILSTIFDGLGIVVLVSLATGKTAFADVDPVTGFVMRLMESAGTAPSTITLLVVVATLLSLKTVLNVALAVSEAGLMARVRLEIQEAAFTSILLSSWDHLRDLRVGVMTGALTEEAQSGAKYLLQVVRGGYFVLGTCVFSSIALAVSPQLSLLLGVVGLPFVLVLRWLFGAQARWSMRQTRARQDMTGSIAERLNNLFQIKAEGNEKYHVRDGLRQKSEIARLEVIIGWGQAFIGNLNSFVLLSALAGFYLWCRWRNIELSQAFALLAGVAMVGSRAVTQFNNAVATFGNLARLGGSILPVHNLIVLPRERTRKLIPGRLSEVILSDVGYRFSEVAGVSNISFRISVEAPLVIRGASGSGKTTLANLIGGLYAPMQGSVIYTTAEGGQFDSRVYRARVGYVTQDIYLFHGSVRENLMRAGEPMSDVELWDLLEKAGAAEFVRRIGGLGAELTEGGRSLSGGEQRRLGIARVLASRPDILILDEITSGLDDSRKAEIGALIEQLAQSLVAVAITHDLGEFRGWREWRTSAPSHG